MERPHPDTVDGVNGTLAASPTAPPAPDAPVVAAAPDGMFASLRIRNYRLFASGRVVSLVGYWMQVVAQDWLVLGLSGGSPTALGVAAALQFGPTVLLSLWGGVLADRYDKRRLLLAAQAGLGGCALVLGLLDLGGLVTLWQVYLLCVVLGCFSAVNLPVYQSFVSELVGPQRLPNAVALNAVTYNIARIIGPAVAGLVIVVVGTGWLFLLNAASFVVVILGLARMDPARLHRAPPSPRTPGQLRAGLRYVQGRPELVAVLALMFFLYTFGTTWYVTLAPLARNTFGLGADAYGLLLSLLASGALVGSVLAARRSGPPPWRLMVGAALAFGVLEVTAGVMPSFALTGATLVAVGVAGFTFTTTASTTLLLSIAPAMRGRVSGLHMLMVLGGAPLAAPSLGTLAEALGARAPIITGGVISALAAIGAWALLRRRGELLLPEDC